MSHQIPTPRVVRQLPPCRILVAEDHEMNRQLVRAILERFGATIIEAKNGREAVERVAEERSAGRALDLVLMDLTMPELDGFGATRELRAAGFAAPIVAITGNGTESDRRECLASGFDDFAAKPVRKDKLLEIVATRLGSKAPEEGNPR
ncbi:MAG: response regulator [bacterium]